MRKDSVVISGSASLQDDMKKWVGYWEEQGTDVLDWPIPIPDDEFDVEWPKIHEKFYNALYEADILFVANVGKNGISGYVGPNTFAEISFAVGLNFVRTRKIRVILFSLPTDESPYGEALRLWIQNGWLEIFEQEVDTRQHNVSI